MLLLARAVLFAWFSVQVSLLIHEHGHLLAGLLLRLHGSTVGVGDPNSPVAWRGTTPWATYQIHRHFGGVTSAYYGYSGRSRPLTRGMTILLALAGPVANLTIALLLWHWTARSLQALFDLDLVGAFDWAFAGAVGLINLWLGLFNLLPLQRGEAETDGMLILRTLRE